MLKIDVSNGNKIANLLLRIGLATVLLYASVSSFITPADWIGYLPHFLTSCISGKFLLHVFSVYELLLAIWLLLGTYIKYAALIAALTFSGIILTNTGLLAVTFRDITMVFASLALIFIK